MIDEGDSMITQPHLAGTVYELHSFVISLPYGALYLNKSKNKITKGSDK